MITKTTLLKVSLLSLVTLILSSPIIANPLFETTRIGSEKGAPIEKGISLRCLDIIKVSNDYQVLGVFLHPNNELYIWKGSGKIVDKNLIIKYSGIVGESSGQAKLYFNKEGGTELLFNDTVFELQETP